MCISAVDGVNVQGDGTFGDRQGGCRRRPRPPSGRESPGKVPGAAARARQMPRQAFDGSGRAPALRFAGVAKDGLQKLWERSFRSKEERDAAKDALPMRCDASWFRKVFLETAAPDSLGPADPVWPYVKGFNEYDGLACIAAVAASHAPLLHEFFKPHQCPKSNIIAIGMDEKAHNILNTGNASELLHDCLVLSFDRRIARTTRWNSKWMVNGSALS